MGICKCTGENLLLANRKDSKHLKAIRIVDGSVLACSV